MKHKIILGTILLCALSSTTFAQRINQNSLKGKYLVLAGAECAGLKFNAQATAAAWQNEMDCSHGYYNKDAWRIT